MQIFARQLLKFNRKKCWKRNSALNLKKAHVNLLVHGIVVEIYRNN